MKICFNFTNTTSTAITPLNFSLHRFNSTTTTNSINQNDDEYESLEKKEERRQSKLWMKYLSSEDEAATKISGQENEEQDEEYEEVEEVIEEGVEGESGQADSAEAGKSVDPSSLIQETLALNPDETVDAKIVAESTKQSGEEDLLDDFDDEDLDDDEFAEARRRLNFAATTAEKVVSSETANLKPAHRHQSVSQKDIVVENETQISEELKRFELDEIGSTLNVVPKKGKR